MASEEARGTVSAQEQSLITTVHHTLSRAATSTLRTCGPAANGTIPSHRDVPFQCVFDRDCFTVDEAAQTSGCNTIWQTAPSAARTSSGLLMHAAALVRCYWTRSSATLSCYAFLDDVGLSGALTGSSCQTCGELGWHRDVIADAGIVNYPSVCAASSVFPGADGTCNTQLVTFDQALQVCSIAGARLCSVDEVYGGVSRGTGVRLALQLLQR